MTVLLSVLLIAGTLLIWWLRRRYAHVRTVVDGLGFIAFLAFFITASTAVIRTVLDQTVFMTQVHEVFLNPVFQVSGGWLGLYTAVRLLEGVWASYQAGR